MKFLPFFSFCIILTSCTSKKPHEINVGVQPYGNIENHIIDSVAQTMALVYGFNTVVLDRKEIPQSAFVQIKSARYRADTLLKHLKRTQADSIDYTIGLLNEDISTTKKDAFGNINDPKSKYEDWGIFGLGYSPGPSCVVSTHRIRNRNANKNLHR